MFIINNILTKVKFNVILQIRNKEQGPKWRSGHPGAGP